MVKSLPRPAAAMALAVAVLGLLAVLWHTGKPTGPDCRAEQAAHAEARPGFVALAGNGVEACFKP